MSKKYPVWIRMNLKQKKMNLSKKKVEKGNREKREHFIKTDSRFK